MTRLAFDDYLRHLRADSTRLRTVLAGCDPEARVPGCPDWTAANLLGHHGGVLQFWADIVEQRPAGPDDDWTEPEKPASYDDLLAYHEEQEARLVAALAAADPAEEAWTWSSEQTVGFTFRRQAHEALIHRLDAEQTAGEVTPLDPVLATDGVEEALAVMFGGGPTWGTFTGYGRHVRVDVADTGASIWVELGRFTGTDPESGKVYDEDDIAAVADPGSEPDAVLVGPAADLDAWLWRRGGDDRLEVSGDRTTYDAFRRVVNQAIE
ncbi:maleylpyruvate isomerase family mycothiol-dependent enzyme [Nocardioides sp. MAH-18]|uniref:Maleylpyruvate isomerase family mycothiol-dependent enzyme n=1 Tax=Nocardioides agri TaxID=2682843 RepID=A0A6L6XL60_9ACTN|nr:MULTISPECIES: maleylpyruvate isomerase family mycothiol-dependent enzyme [unclassified Nocardioides]MBA2952970.1 maleylpyruvate isomerase family mycothiol-dependent enzyme [Nocardioides sp. CGMCC 1.13656]MVQ47840.1 maleylpyruvate isomerase family mycothiol-dependent enzyme [Nocardioides sp. MAH-18]